MNLIIAPSKLVRLCCFFVICCGYSQNTKTLVGQIQAGKSDVLGVTIQNLNSKMATISNRDGSFSIMVKVNDTLVFSAVQFQEKRLTITKEIFDASRVLVQMDQFINELQEVVVRPYNLTGKINQDLNSLTLVKDVNAEELNLPNANVRIVSQSENKLYDADHGKFLYVIPLGIALNVNKTLNRLSGRTKKLNNRVALDKAYEALKKVERRYSDSIVLTDLKIPKDKFHDFFYYCQMDNKFNELRDGDELLLWEFLFQKSKSFRENNKLD